MDQQDIYHKEKNKNNNKDKGKGQVNIQNWIAQQTENVKLNQHQQKESGSWHHQQQNNFQQQQGFRLNLMQNQQLNKGNGQLQNNQQSRNQTQNPIKISNFQEDQQSFTFQKDQFGTFNQKLHNINLENIEEFKGSNDHNRYEQNNFYDLQEEYDMQEQNEDEYNGNQNIQNFQNNELCFNQSNKHYQLGELLQSHENILQSDKKSGNQIQKQDQDIQKNQHPIPQLSMSYERSIQQKLQQEMQAQLHQQQQNTQISDQQNSSQEMNSSQEQRMRIEKQFQKSVPNKIYTFPRKFSDSEEYDSEGSSSFESLEGVIKYDLHSQNLPKVQIVQNFNQLNPAVYRELDNLQRSFQNSIFSIINNQITTSNQAAPNQQKNNHLNFLSLSNLPSDQTNGLDNFTSDGGDKTNLQSDQINEFDNFASAGQEANSNSQKRILKQDLTNTSKTTKFNQEANNEFKMKIQDQNGEQKQAQVMKKILKEGKVKFQNTNDQQKSRQVGNNQVNKAMKFANQGKFNQNNSKNLAEPLTIEDYQFDDDDDEDDQNQVITKQNQHNGNKNDDDFTRHDDNMQTQGEYDRRLKTEGNDLNYDDDNASEAAHKLYDNNDSEISEDVVIIPLSSNQGQFQNGTQQLSSSNYSKQINLDQNKQNDANFEQHKQMLDFSKQKQIQNNNISAISANFISTNNNSNKNFNLINGGVISTNSQASNAYHSMNSGQSNIIDNISLPAAKQLQHQQQQEINDCNTFGTKQNIQRPSSSIQGSNSNNLAQTQKKNKQQQRLMETLKMNFNNQSIFNSQNFSQQKQFTKTLSKSKESVSASMNCNTLSDLIKKKDTSKTTKKVPPNQQLILHKQRETPAQNSKQRQTVYTSIGSMNNYSLIQDQQASVELGNQLGNNNSNLIDISQNPLPSKVVKRTGSQARDSKLRNHRLKTDSSNPTFQATNQTTANINNHNQSKVEKSRERTSSASKKKVTNTNYSTNQQSKSTNQVDKFKKDVLIQKSHTQKIEKTPIRNKVNEQNSNKNTGSKKTNISNGQYHQQNQSNIIVNQPAQQLLQYAAKQQQKQNQIAQHNMIHKYSSSPDSYATAAANNYLNFQQNPQQVQQLHNIMNIQSQLEQNLNQPQLINQQILQQTINQMQQQGAIRENSSPHQKNMNQHLQQQYQQQQQLQQQHILQNPIIVQHFQQNLNNPQQFNQGIQSHQHNQIQQILQNAQMNIAKQQQQQQHLNQKQTTYQRQSSPNQIFEENHITQNKLYQQAKSSLAKFRNEDDTPKQITKSQVLNQGVNKLTKKSILTTSIDKSSKDKKRVSEKISDKLKTRIKTEPADYDDQSFIFSSNRNNSSKPHISPQLNSFLLQDANSKGDITKNINLSQNRANKSTTRTRNKQNEKTKNFENEISRGESSTEKEQNNTLKSLLLMYKKK